MANIKFKDILNEGPNFSLAHDKIEKWMPNDRQDQQEFYKLVDKKDVNGLADFIDMVADWEVLSGFSIKDKDTNGLAKYIVMNESTLTEASKRKLSSSDMKKIEKVVDDAETMISNKFNNPDWRDDYSTKDMINIIVTIYNQSEYRNTSLQDLLDAYDVKKQKDNVYGWKDEMQEGISWRNKPRLTESREFVVIDPRGNARPVGSKSQGSQYTKKMGGPRKGYFIVLKKNALKARRAIEKAGGRFIDSKLQDTMFDLMYEGKINEEYIESMDDQAIDKHLSAIEMQWLDWKRGPMTDKEDVKPAAKELTHYILLWMRKTFK